MSDALVEKVLQANIAEKNHWKILPSIDLSTLAAIPERTALVGKFLARTGVAIDAIDAAEA